MEHLKIKRAKNGWIIENIIEGERDEVFVFSHDDDEETEAEAFADLLWRVKECIGPSDSRYSKHRVFVRIERGDKCAVDEEE